ncbi:unnamed protein product [Mytilus coruscus]|uniref:Uncharacterized protein n=1 Tax=Mytilus coruscus TaxID=42192 RepID=A0A6J8BQF0_MYTCO|nr:unnamed protein product [Mytilus coruscus]
MLKEELPAIELKVVRCFSNIDSDTVQWKKNPVPHIMDNLWGCSEKCMFCKKPCMNTNKDHLADKFSHKCLQHRPNGIGGFRNSLTQKMVVDFCNYLVSTDRTYDFKSKNIKEEYKKYKENFPDWDIPPNSDVSKYWMWVMCKYKDELTIM